MTTPTPPNRRQLALREALPILLITLCAGLVLAVLAWRSIGSLRGVAEESMDLSSLAMVCEGEGLPIARPYPSGDPIRPAMVFQRSGDTWQEAADLIPAGATPVDATATELVLCVDPAETVSAPPCTGPDTTTPVSSQRAAMRMLAARTSVVVARETIGPAGELPTCWPEDAPLFSTPAELEAAITTWLAAYTQP